MQDATSLAAAIASGRTTAPEVMDRTLAAAARQAAYGATVVVDDALARKEAAGHHAGPFAGVPFLGKDLGSASGAFPIGAGSPAMRARASRSGGSVLFERFKAAGLVQAGLTTVPPFGLALTSDPARNPFDADYSPGGSSGGAAAAVAAGIVAIAHATDAAGSIRVPAACCGLFGLKPSRGAIPAGPDFGNHLMGLASELVLARSLRDVATAFAAVSGEAQGFCADPTEIGFASPPRIALCMSSRCNTEQSDAARHAAEALRQHGSIVREVPAPDALGHRAASVARTILTASLAEWIDALGVGDDELPPIAAAIAAEGRTMPATALFAVSRAMAQVGFELWNSFSDFDVILSPVLSEGPPRYGAFDMMARSPSAHFAAMEEIAPHAALANVVGAPALALPFGSDRRGLPIGVQIMGRSGSDRALLALAATLEGTAPAIRFPFPVAGHA